MLSLNLLGAHCPPIHNAPAGLLSSERRRRDQRGCETPARPAAVILAKRIHSFLRAKSTPSASPSAPGRAIGHVAASGSAGAPLDNSLLRRNIPCSGNENSLFRIVQGIHRKRFKSPHNQASAGAGTGASGAKSSKYPVEFPPRREFAAADRAVCRAFLSVRSGARISPRQTVSAPPPEPAPPAPRSSRSGPGVRPGSPGPRRRLPW
jgi:hypothetical protein